MLPSTALQFVQQHPLITTNSPEFRNLGLRDDQRHELAYQLIESYPFIGQTNTVYNSKGGSSETMSVTASQVGSIKKYLKAFIDVDHSALENHFPGFNAANPTATTAGTISAVRATSSTTGSTSTTLMICSCRSGDSRLWPMIPPISASARIEPDLPKDLLFDSKGSLKFKSDMWNDIRKVIFPTL